MALYDDLFGPGPSNDPLADRRDVLRPLQPAEEDSLLSRLGSRTLSGVSYAAGSLNKPGRVVRGLLAGKPRELLNVLPFSDTLGITDESQATSGDDLLKQWGLKDQGYKPDGFLDSVANAAPGFAFDVATDPLTYLTFGGSALSKFGQTARRVGALPSSLADRIKGFSSVADAAAAMGRNVPDAIADATKVGVDLKDLVGKPLGGLAGLRFPFSESATPIGTGPTAQKVAEGLGWFGDRAAYSGPGRSLSALFDPRVKGQTGEELQRYFRQESKANAVRQAGTNLSVANAADPVLEHPELTGLDGPTRSAVEGVLPAFPGPYSPHTLAAIDRAAQGFRSVDDATLKAMQDAGVPVSELQSEWGLGHAFRGRTPLPNATGQARGGIKELSGRVGQQIQREPILDLPGGTAQVNQLVQDARISGRDRLLQPPDVENVIRQTLGVDPNRLKQLQGLAGPLTPTEAAELAKLESLEGKVKPLQRYLGALDPQRREVGLFGNDLFADLARSTREAGRAVENSEAAQHLIGLRPELSPQAPYGYASAPSLLEELGYTGTRDVNGQRVKAAQQTLLDALNAQGFFGQTPGTIADLKNVHVPPDLAQQVLALKPRSVTPSYLDPLLEKFDSFTNLFKSLNTAPFPGNQVRNAITDYWNNVAEGLSPTRAFQGAKDFNALRQGPGTAIAGAGGIPYFSGLSDAEATRELAKEYFGQGLAGTGFGVTREARGGVSDAKALADIVPGATPQRGLLEALSGYLPRSKSEANPLNVAGVGGRNETLFAPVKAGREFGEGLYDAQRGGAFLERLREGYTPQAAAEAVGRATGDYQLTDFERRYLRRLAPFYSWAQANTPQQFRRLIEQPGGLTANALRLSDTFRQKDGFLPPYLGGGLAVPVGGEDETGTQRYLTKLDLPYEGALDQFHFGKGGAEKTLMNLLGQLNPLVKGPLELGTNRQFYSGRELDDLYSRTGLPLADQVIMNSPGARALTTGSTLLDPRKDKAALALNLLTGLRLSDVDMNRQRNTAERDLVDELLKGDANINRHTDLSVKPDAYGQISPDEIDLMRLYKTQEKRAQAAAKAKKQATGK